MKRIRRFEIMRYCKEWENLFSDMSYKDCFNVLLKDRIITKKEFKYLIEKLN